MLQGASSPRSCLCSGASRLYREAFEMVVKVAGLSYPRHVSEEVDLLARALGSASEVYLFVDYGGTLTPGTPNDAGIPNRDVLARLEQLGNEETFNVFVLSGRTVDELDRLLGVENIGLIGQRGFEIRRRYSEIEHPVDPETIGSLIHHLELNAHSCLEAFNGFSLENRGFALSLMLGDCTPEAAREISQRFLRAARELDAGGQLEVLYGDRSIEVRLAGWHKGNAISHILKGADVEDALAIYMGDDVTDEDAFEAVKDWAEADLPEEGPWFVSDGDDEDEEPAHALTILVADRPRPTMASLFVRGPQEVYEFLSSLAAIATALM